MVLCLSFATHWYNTLMHAASGQIVLRVTTVLRSNTIEFDRNGFNKLNAFKMIAFAERR